MHRRRIVSHRDEGARHPQRAFTDRLEDELRTSLRRKGCRGEKQPADEKATPDRQSLKAHEEERISARTFRRGSGESD